MLNQLKARREAGTPAFGTFTYSPDPALVEIAGRAGMDFVIIDTEHTQLDAGDVTTLIRAARGVGVTSFVRVGEPTPTSIGRALDAGAAGVVLPHVSDELVAGALASAARYPPIGIRSACTCSPATDYSLTDFSSYVASADSDTWVIGLVEDRLGVERIEEIVTSGHLNVIMPGPSDLAASFEVPGALDHPLVVEAVERIVEAVNDHPEVEMAMYVSDPAQVRRWAERGVRIFVYSIDYKLIASAYRTGTAQLAQEFDSREVV